MRVRKWGLARGSASGGLLRRRRRIGQLDLVHASRPAATPANDDARGGAGAKTRRWRTAAWLQPLCAAPPAAAGLPARAPPTAQVHSAQLDGDGHWEARELFCVAEIERFGRQRTAQAGVCSGEGSQALARWDEVRCAAPGGADLEALQPWSLFRAPCPKRAFAHPLLRPHAPSPPPPASRAPTTRSLSLWWGPAAPST